MKHTPPTIVRRSAAILLFAAATTAALSASVPTHLKPLAKTLKDAGYLIYIPFRAEDNPAAVFVYAKDVSGQTNEFQISHENYTFTPTGTKAWTAQGGALLGESTSKVSSSFDFALSLLKSIFDVGGKFSNVKEVKISLPVGKDEQEIRRFPLDFDFGNISNGTRNALRFYKDRGQLSSTYIVLETYWGSSISIEMTSETDASAHASVEALKSVDKAKLEVSYAGKNSFTLKIKQGVNIGYKAMRVSDTMIAPYVSGSKAKGVELPVSELERLRFGEDAAP
jgi:hypothetical protein